MGIIRASIDAVRRTAADQWIEKIVPSDTSEGIMATPGVRDRADSSQTQNTKGTAGVISNGSYIEVPENYFMLLVDNGKIVDFTSEPGMYVVDDSSAPSIFAGNLKEDVKAIIMDTWNRIKFGGTTPQRQSVMYINLQEIKDIKFGTATPVMYYDSVYGVDLTVRAHGSYSVHIVDPLKFYAQVLGRDGATLHKDNYNDQYKNEFIEGLATALSNLSVQNVRISHITSYSKKLSDHMGEILDASWLERAGIQVTAVAIVGLSYTEKSAEIIEMRNKGAILSDPNVREGYVQGAIARGFEAAGSNEAGAAGTFMGMGMGMNTAGGMFGQMSQSNQEQMQREAQKTQQQQPQTPQASMAGAWSCPQCSTANDGKFCSNCGTAKPEEKAVGFCSNCGYKFQGEKPKFCQNCGTPVQE
ncbi:MAG: virion core protein [Tissierellia bacterium]|nr:virion core protein [Tissierellia bacterium]